MARNDITNDSIANTKGSAEKYAQGWERLFGGKTVANGQTLCVACGETVEYEVAKKHDPIYCKYCGNHFSVYWSDEHTTVMALDFHDSQPESDLQALVRKLTESLPDDLPTVLCGKIDD